MNWTNRTILITGGSRGIGRAIALKMAHAGANIVIAAKSTEEHEKLGGTIYSVAEEIKSIGARALPIKCDIRNEDDIETVINAIREEYGSLDVVVNNASAISLTGTEATSSKQYDLMHDINVRGAFLTVKHALPLLLKSDHAHILTLSPPISMTGRWLGPHIAYTMSKYNMSMLALGWAAEFQKIPIYSNALWPATTIDTAAVRNLLGGDQLVQRSRNTDIIADAAYYILSNNNPTNTGNTLIDEEVLFQNGITDLSKYAINPEMPLYKDLFL